MPVSSESFSKKGTVGLQPESEQCSAEVRGHVNETRIRDRALAQIIEKADRNGFEIKYGPYQEFGEYSDWVLVVLQALDMLNVGVGMINRRGRLLFANQFVKQILRTHDGLEVTTRGMLVYQKTRCSVPLTVLQEPTTQARARAAFADNVAVVVKRPSGKRPLALVICPLSRVRSRPQLIEPAGLLFVLDPDLPVKVIESGFHQMYGLTVSESRLAQLLMSGRSLQECCEHLRIRPSTARMHLANLFAKTGVHRQGQLVSLLLKSLGVVANTSAGQGKLQPEKGLDEYELDPQGNNSEMLTGGLEALDSIDIGLGVIDGVGRLLFANRTAEQIIATRDGLEIRHGVLGALTRCDPPLHTLVRHAAQAGAVSSSVSSSETVAVPRSSGKRPLTLIIRSLSRTTSHPNAARPAAVVFILDPELPIQPTYSTLQPLYGFTTSECRLARLLMEGNALDDCCESLEIRASTGRRHLANMFTKAGVQHQGQLISVLLKSVGTVRTSVMTS